MRILIAHNHYQQKGGEDAVAQSEFNLLKDFGHEVRYYERHNNEIEDRSVLKKLFSLFRIGWSRRSYDDIRKVISEFHPDVVHFHNIFFILTPSVFKACRDEGVPVIQSLHNFRLICPNGLFLRDNQLCEDCAKAKNFMKSIFYGCYKKSRLLTMILAAMLSYHWTKKTWIRLVDVFIMATEFSRKKYIKFGVPAGQIMIKPTIVYPNHFKNDQDGGYALYAGRLSKEKGVEVLLSAWKKVKGFPLKIVGNGPLLNDMKKYVVDEDIKNVEFLGFLSSEDYIKSMQSASFLIMPSLCYENFPCVILEAKACGIPIIASSLGGIPDIIKDKETGFLFEAGNGDDLCEKIKAAIDSEDKLSKMKANILEDYSKKYSSDENYRILMEVYNRAIQQYSNKLNN